MVSGFGKPRAPGAMTDVVLEGVQVLDLTGPIAAFRG
jgi:hypothetical protein